MTVTTLVLLALAGTVVGVAVGACVVVVVWVVGMTGTLAAQSWGARAARDVVPRLLALDALGGLDTERRMARAHRQMDKLLRDHGGGGLFGWTAEYRFTRDWVAWGHVFRVASDENWAALMGPHR